MSRDSEGSRLIHELLDGTIADEDFARLQEILLQDGDLRQDYYALLTTDQMLVQTFGQLRADPTPAVKAVRQRGWPYTLLLALALLLSALVFLAPRWRTPDETAPGSEDRHFLADAPVPAAVIFADDFSEPDGTPIHGKLPDIGQPWTVRDEHSTTRLIGGRLDTSGGFRHLSAGFLDASTPPPHVFLITLRTAEPRVVVDKKQRLSGIERITLLAADRRPIGSLIATAREDHHWRLKNEDSKEESALTTLSAIAPHELTLRYDTATGLLSLHAGKSAQSPMLTRISLTPGAVPVEFEIWNDYGGDLALEEVTVRAFPPSDRR